MPSTCCSLPQARCCLTTQLKSQHCCCLTKVVSGQRLGGLTAVAASSAQAQLQIRTKPTIDNLICHCFFCSPRTISGTAWGQ